MCRNLTKSHAIQSNLPSVILHLLLIVVILLPVHGLVPNDSGSPQILSDTSNVCNGQGRTATCEVQLDVPSACVSPDGTSSCPIVFFLHGAGGTNNGYSMFSDVHENGVIGIYPRGEDGWNIWPKRSNTCHWSDFECTTDPDEGAFFAAIIAEVRSLGGNGNIYAFGNSNGAAMANFLGVNAGEELPIKGIVTDVAQLYESPDRTGPGKLNYCHPGALGGTGPNVSVLNIMGELDPIIPYEGGASDFLDDFSLRLVRPLEYNFLNDLNFRLQHALTSMDTWAIHNGCDPTRIITPVTTNTVAGGDGTGFFLEYEGCSKTIVEHYTINKANHFAGASQINGVRFRFVLAHDFVRRVEALNAEDPNSLIAGLISVENTIFGTCGQLSANPQYIDLVCNLDPRDKAETLSASTICPQACGTTTVEDDPDAQFIFLLVENGEPRVITGTCKWLAHESSSGVPNACNLDLSVWDDYEASSVCSDTCSSR